jgi:hypothetical protein
VREEARFTLDWGEFNISSKHRSKAVQLAVEKASEPAAIGELRATSFLRTGWFCCRIMSSTEFASCAIFSVLVLRDIAMVDNFCCHHAAAITPTVQS